MASTSGTKSSKSSGTTKTNYNSHGPAQTKASKSSKTAQSAKTAKSTKTAKTSKTNVKKAAGANPKLAKVVKSINISQYRAKGKTTFCNRAFNAIAKKLGYSGFNGMVANQMYKKMAAPGSGWKKVDAAGAIAAAKQGKLVAAAWYNNKPMAGRPDGRAPGHIAAVIGEWSKGVPGIAQAGRTTKEWMSIQGTRANPSYFVRQ